MPQVIMLTHAAHVNRQRVKVKADEEVGDDQPVTSRAVRSDMPSVNGKPIDELTSEEYARYLMAD
jgi:hypothetical protein